MGKQKKRKKKKRFAKRVAALAVIVIVVLLARREVVDWNGTFETDHHPAATPQAVQLNGSGSSDDASEEVMAQLNEMAKTDRRIRRVVRHAEEYPEELLALLSRNEETVDFVMDYTKKSQAAPANSVGKVTKGQIPELLQWDERWGYQKYGDSIMAISGCGPTALSMVASGLTGDSRITPCKVAEYADQNKYYVNGYGSSWTLMSKGSAAFGIQAKELSLNQNVITSQLKAGHPVICSMRPGDFTTSGHFIVLTGVENGEFQVNDPNSRDRSAQLWDYDTLKPQISNLWAFQLK